MRAKSLLIILRWTLFLTLSTTDQRCAWVEKQKIWLSEGKIKQVIQACSEYLDHPDAAEAAHQAAMYYTNNQRRMDYSAYREKGYWIGSGTIESACKQIASARLKIAGARWTIQGAIKTAKVRAAWLSDDNCFDRITSFPLAVEILHVFSAPHMHLIIPKL